MHMPDPQKTGLVHIVGIGGIGMSAIAELMRPCATVSITGTRWRRRLIAPRPRSPRPIKPRVEGSGTTAAAGAGTGFASRLCDFLVTRQTSSSVLSHGPRFVTLAMFAGH